MPAVNGPPDNYFQDLLRQFATRPDALEAVGKPVAVSSGQLTGTVSAVAGAWRDLGFPAFSVNVGSSGKLQLTASSQIMIPSSASIEVGQVGIGVDGAAPTGQLAAQLLAVSGAASSAPNVSAGVTLVISGLTPGTHTLKCWFQSALTTCSFLNTFLQAQPL